MYVINYANQKSSEPPTICSICCKKHALNILNQILQDQKRSRKVPHNKQVFQEVLYRLVLVKVLDIRHQMALSLLKESMLQPQILWTNTAPAERWHYTKHGPPPQPETHQAQKMTQTDMRLNCPQCSQITYCSPLTKEHKEAGNLQLPNN